VKSISLSLTLYKYKKMSTIVKDPLNTYPFSTTSFALATNPFIEANELLYVDKVKLNSLELLQ
jgi:hypothetical protein